MCPPVKTNDIATAAIFNIMTDDIAMSTHANTVLIPCKDHVSEMHNLVSSQLVVKRRSRLYARAGYIEGGVAGR